ncbi:hypothetical protein GGI07_002312 [Coemansia sp. Benny D115]|nr:hypothetical protein GGI07_002312 [Coemansia sp. Benny D115]
MGVYPGAFVEVAREELERLPVGAQLRVVCAGVWHNAATALLIWLLMVSGGLWWILGSTLWSPVTDGVVITEMDAASPLLGRLPLLSTVYRIDDVCLAPGDTCLGGLVNGTVGAPEARYGTTAIARWTNILMRSKSNRELASGGYCVSLNDNMDDGLCCEMTAQHPLGESPDGRLYCFEPYKVRLLENREPMCFDLHLVLQRQSSQRCRDHGDCSIQGDFGSEHQTVCALPSSPYASSRVMRLYYRTLAGVDDMVIYVGSPKGLWLDVRVSTLVPRWPGVRSLLGGGVELMPRRVESLLQYVLSFSVAFCLLNALPAWHLDGEHILRLVMLSLLGASSRSGSGGSGEDKALQRRRHSATATPSEPKNSAKTLINDKAEDGRDKTRSSKNADQLGTHHDEPPLLAQSSSKQCHYRTAEEVDSAIKGLRRKLRRFTLRPRTTMKLDAMWQRLWEIRRAAVGWRLSSEEIEQFLRAILRVGPGVEWAKRAQGLAEEETDPSMGVVMASLRVYAKTGDIRRFNHAVDRAERLWGPQWWRELDDYIETRVILFARADLPAQAASLLKEHPRAVRPRAELAKGEPPPPRAQAMRELLLAWTRAHSVVEAWLVLNELLELGYGRSSREWNGILHFYAVDPRYQISLLEQVLLRMREANVAYDEATYNIMMHASLLRGSQVHWRMWHSNMVRAGHKPNAHTYVAVATHMVTVGKWAEARDTLKQMRKSGVTPTAVARQVEAQAIDEGQNRVAGMMRALHRQVRKGDQIDTRMFLAVAQAALKSPKLWAPEIALLKRCLEAGMVEAGPVVDAMAMRLPGMNARAASERPLMRAGSMASAGDALARTIKSGMRSEPGLALVSGSERLSFTDTLHVVLRGLLRGQDGVQASDLVAIADHAKIPLLRPHTAMSMMLHGAQFDLLPDTNIKSAMFFWPPTAQPAALLEHSVRIGDMVGAREHANQLVPLLENYPSIRGFNSLLLFACSMQDADMTERVWRQMQVRGILPDSQSHERRVRCYAMLDEKLLTRRAYSEMLEHGFLPTASATNAFIRCCVRNDELELARTALSHAEDECGVAQTTATYNLILSRLYHLPDGHDRMLEMFQRMLDTTDARLCKGKKGGYLVNVADPANIDRMVRFGGARMLGGMQATMDKRMRKALVNWLTSPATFSAAPTLSGEALPGSETADQKGAVACKGSAGEPSPSQQPTPPPPDSTSFMIVIRVCGLAGDWPGVLHAWDQLAVYNCRLDSLAKTRALCLKDLNSMRVRVFSRMVGWVILALHVSGRVSDAQELWVSSVRDRVLSKRIVEQGYSSMISELSQRVLDVEDE